MSLEPAVLLERLGASWLEAARDCLHPEEEARARRFHRPLDRDSWRAGRAWIRHQLAAALTCLPASIAFTIDPRGRPQIGDAPAGFDCNWSHSGPWIALAVNRDGPVGIDIEVVRSDFPVDEVEATVCTTAERDALAATSSVVERTRLFFRLWTAKEALMKATGLGAALDPARIAVRLHDGQPCAYDSHPGWHIAGREGADWVAMWTWAESRPQD